jgi:hypothetical protein
MDTRDSRGAGWRTFSGLVLALGGIFAVTYGLTAVFRSTFFANDAVFVFSDLNTWGWITFGLGAVAIASGLAVFSGREWARWTGIAIAGLGALGQLMIAQAYPLWSLMIMAVYVLAVYGLAVYGVRDAGASARSRGEDAFAGTTDRVTPISGESERERRAA